MKTTIFRLIILSSVFCLFLLINVSAQDNAIFKYTIKINYGEGKKVQDTVITAVRKLSALEALQYATTVETHPIAGYVFVTAINNVKGKRGVMAWYYEVNNQPTKTLAINYLLENEATIQWNYKKDVCSGTVDKKSIP